eukprot:CAMPEP_0184494426 /NCGR_PEP_ID=MMETSP0113_2-20130426/28688_1 /TAXON_ID=91329 /ORGANISM="Norrisiella sphaerica, Strain BC52" /LENGTH=901 /DNA_ID=CAMNT_0026880173 /DNA_START=188 /DNA_END=2891 /DNA_ORIENTATION=+
MAQERNDSIPKMNPNIVRFDHVGNQKKRKKVVPPPYLRCWKREQPPKRNSLEAKVLSKRPAEESPLCKDNKHSPQEQLSDGIGSCSTPLLSVPKAENSQLGQSHHQQMTEPKLKCASRTNSVRGAREQVADIGQGCPQTLTPIVHSKRNQRKKRRKIPRKRGTFKRCKAARLNVRKSVSFVKSSSTAPLSHSSPPESSLSRIKCSNPEKLTSPRSKPRDSARNNFLETEDKGEFEDDDDLTETDRTAEASSSDDGGILCYCQRTELGGEVECGQCKRWIHPQCDSRLRSKTTEQIQKSNFKYTCPECLLKGNETQAEARTYLQINELPYFAVIFPQKAKNGMPSDSGAKPRSRILEADGCRVDWNLFFASPNFLFQNLNASEQTLDKKFRDRYQRDTVYKFYKDINNRISLLQNLANAQTAKAINDFGKLLSESIKIGEVTIEEHLEHRQFWEQHSGKSLFNLGSDSKLIVGMETFCKKCDLDLKSPCEALKKLSTHPDASAGGFGKRRRRNLGPGNHTQQKRQRKTPQKFKSPRNLPLAESPRKRSKKAGPTQRISTDAKGVSEIYVGCSTRGMLGIIPVDSPAELSRKLVKLREDNFSGICMSFYLKRLSHRIRSEYYGVDRSVCRKRKFHDGTSGMKAAHLLLKVAGKSPLNGFIARQIQQSIAELVVESQQPGAMQDTSNRRGDSKGGDERDGEGEKEKRASAGHESIEGDPKGRREYHHTFWHQDSLTFYKDNTEKGHLMTTLYYQLIGESYWNATCDMRLGAVMNLLQVCYQLCPCDRDQQTLFRDTLTLIRKLLAKVYLSCVVDHVELRQGETLYVPSWSVHEVVSPEISIAYAQELWSEYPQRNLSEEVAFPGKLKTKDSNTRNPEVMLCIVFLDKTGPGVSFSTVLLSESRS